MLTTVLASALLALTLAAPAPNQKVDAFAGTWIAEFDGNTFVRLEMSVNGGSLSGRIALGDIVEDFSEFVAGGWCETDDHAP